MFLATQDKPFFAQELGAKFNDVKEMGFDAFEIDGRLLLDSAAEVEKASRESDLPVRMVCGGYSGWIGDFAEEKRQSGLRDIIDILNHCGAMGIDGIVVPAAWGMFSLRLPPMTPPRSARQDREVLLDSLTKLDNAAGQSGTSVFLEPLNRYENHMILRVEEAVSLIKEGNLKNTKVTADFFHMNIEEANIENTLTEYAGYIGHIHLASSQRIQPGAGHLDYLPGFRALKAGGYQGGFSVECRVEAEEPASAYKNSVEFIRKSLVEAGF